MKNGNEQSKIAFCVEIPFIIHTSHSVLEINLALIGLPACELHAHTTLGQPTSIQQDAAECVVFFRSIYSQLYEQLFPSQLLYFQNSKFQRFISSHKVFRKTITFCPRVIYEHILASRVQALRDPPLCTVRVELII